MRLFHRARPKVIHKFDCIILVINPQGSNIQRIENRAKELSKLFPDTAVKVVETVVEPARFRRRLQKSLDESRGRILLGIGGGDGTVHLVANTLMRIEPKVNLSRIVLLPLWGGNANDLACMLNGLSSTAKLKAIFAQGQVVTIHPLEIKTTNSSKKNTIRYSVCYASFGASAYTADQLAKPTPRKQIFGKSIAKGIVNEVGRAVRAMLDAPGFDVDQNGQRVKIFEQLFSNGSRMAKVDRLPIRLTDRTFYHTIRSDKPATVPFILKMLQGNKLGVAKRTPVRFTTRERAWAQFDGEATTIPENTRIVIRHGKRPLYALSTKLSPERRRPRKKDSKLVRRWRKLFLFIFAVVLFHGWLHITNPYADASIVERPYDTYVKNGQIKMRKNYTMPAYSNWAARTLGYYKSGFLIVQNTFLPPRSIQTDQVDTVIDNIHEIRFDPEKPYLISGNQFSVLYPRNLGVFYNSILDPRTARSQADWENRQRIYLQSALYALDAFSSENKLTTTIVPISSKGTLLTEVHPGSIASDSLYGMLYAFRALSQPAVHTNPPYEIQTIPATTEILVQRQSDLRRLLDIYIQSVQDSESSLVKRHIKLSSARDGVTRDSSFYDNVILWKTLSLADELKIKDYTPEYLGNLHSKIIDEYWDDKTGIFSDGYRESNEQAAFSADWLIAMPTGFLDIDQLADRLKIIKIVDYSEREEVTRPLPIKYTVASTSDHAPIAVRWFVPNYGGDAIWSYWGSEYITLLNDLNQVTQNVKYANQAALAIQAYDERIIRYGGFPETYNPDGTFLKTFFYKSILETGWVVQYEKARYECAKCATPASSSF